jgi:uncharacterized Zn-finger protein
MAFQFTCPQGHLLEADVSAAGQQCTCPHCGMLFIIPAPPAAASYAPPIMPYTPATAPNFAPAHAQIGPPQPAPLMPATTYAPAAFAGGYSAPPPQPALPNINPTFSAAGAPAVLAPSAPAPVPAPVDVVKPAEILHIPCPNGHELDTPRDMLDQEVLCPHCGEQFHLREKDSVEFKRKKQQEAEAKDYKRGKMWLNWAIVVAVLVLIGLAVLIFATSG